jgi:hypothetical protein
VPAAVEPVRLRHPSGPLAVDDGEATCSATIDPTPSGDPETKLLQMAFERR